MYRKEDLLRDVAAMHLDPRGTLLIHSSCKAASEVEGGAETILDAWSESMKDGLLIFPTHTWAAIGEENPVFDAVSSPSCVGILPELFRKRPGVVRSLHPTHSVAALGRDAASYTAGEETRTTPCPREGCWGRLYDRDATILFLGCTLQRNTFIHSVEEWLDIPDRLTDGYQQLVSVAPDGRRFHIPMRRHYCSVSNDVSRNFGKLEAPFRKLGVISYARFGDALCVYGKARRMADVASALLQMNPQLFSDGEPIPTRWYA